jgi:hypothetical protein
MYLITYKNKNCKGNEMKYRIRKTNLGKYEIYYLKDYGNGYGREHLETFDTRAAAEKKLDRLTGKDVKDCGQYHTRFTERIT